MLGMAATGAVATSGFEPSEDVERAERIARGAREQAPHRAHADDAESVWALGPAPQSPLAQRHGQGACSKAA